MTTVPRDRIRQIVADTAARHDLTPRDIYERGKFVHIYAARRAAIIAVASEFPKLSSTQLGRLFRRDYTTILYALGRLSRSPYRDRP